MKIRNVNGSSKVSSSPPSKYSSWLNYWEQEANCILNPEEPYECPACGGSFFRKDFNGCHVQKVGYIYDLKWYIVPLCSSCNQKDTILEIEDLLVPVPSNL